MPQGILFGDLALIEEDRETEVFRSELASGGAISRTGSGAKVEPRVSGGCVARNEENFSAKRRKTATTLLGRCSSTGIASSAARYFSIQSRPLLVTSKMLLNACRSSCVGEALYSNSKDRVKTLNELTHWSRCEEKSWLQMAPRIALLSANIFLFASWTAARFAPAGELFAMFLDRRLAATAAYASRANQFCVLVNRTVSARTSRHGAHSRARKIFIQRFSCLVHLVYPIWIGLRDASKP